MNIVNPSLPTGNKFYPLFDASLIEAKTILSRETYDTLKQTRELIQKGGLNSNHWLCTSAYAYLKFPDGTDKYPKIKIRGHDLHFISYIFHITKAHNKSSYAAINRANGIPIQGDGREYITIQFDEKRNGIIVYDQPYEGELVSNKPMVINRQLKEFISERVNELALAALIGAEPKDLKAEYWNDKSSRMLKLDQVLPKLLSGKFTDQDLAQAAQVIKAFGTEWVPNVGYCLDLDKPNQHDFDIGAGTRTKLIYMLGGYKLPEDYQDWFDG